MALAAKGVVNRRQRDLNIDTKPANEAGSPRHETRDASPRNIVLFAVGLFILIGFGLAASVGVFRFFAHRQTLGPPASPFENVRTLPPGPRLQVAPERDLGRYLAGQEQELTSYGWTERQSGKVRVPIDQAMDLLLKKGLPVRAAPPKPAASEIKPSEVNQMTPQGYTPR